MPKDGLPLKVELCNGFTWFCCSIAHKYWTWVEVTNSSIIHFYINCYCKMSKEGLPLKVELCKWLHLDMLQSSPQILDSGGSE